MLDRNFIQLTFARMRTDKISSGRKTSIADIGRAIMAIDSLIALNTSSTHPLHRFGLRQRYANEPLIKNTY